MTDRFSELSERIRNRTAAVGVVGIGYVGLPLAIGLAGLLGGVGSMAGFYLLTDPDVQATWPLGLIAVFFGLGLLLFVRLTRAAADVPQQKSPRSTSTESTPCIANSRKTAAPLMPAPTPFSPG